MLIALIALLTPFVQLGTSYYASIATAMLVLGLVVWAIPLARGAGRIAPLLIVALFMPLSMIDAPSDDRTADFLRIGREATMFVILLSAMAGLPGIELKKRFVPPYRVLAGLAVFFLILALAQTYFLNLGVYFGLPQTWYAQESNTLASDLSLIYTADSLRPHATFAEPSYFGFILLSMALMVIPRLGRDRLTLWTLAIIVVAGLLSRSLAFFLALILVIVIPMVLERGRNAFAIIGGMVVLAIPLILFSGSSMLSRLGSATTASTADASTSDRVFGPLEALPGYLAQYPVGNPIAIADRALIPFLSNRTLDAADILNNALFNFFFAYGFVGFLLVGTILFGSRDLRVRLYMLTCTMFNGAFLAIDKVAIICLTLAIYEFGKRAVAQLSLPAPDPVAAEAPSIDAQPVKARPVRARYDAR